MYRNNVRNILFDFTHQKDVLDFIYYFCRLRYNELRTDVLFMKLTINR